VKKLQFSNKFQVQNENNHGNLGASLIKLIASDEGVDNEHISKFEVNP
jgi:hypothetical protein